MNRFKTALVVLVILAILSGLVIWKGKEIASRLETEWIKRGIISCFNNQKGISSTMLGVARDGDSGGESILLFVYISRDDSSDSYWDMYALALGCALEWDKNAKSFVVIDHYFKGFTDALTGKELVELRIYYMVSFRTRETAKAFIDSDDRVATLQNQYQDELVLVYFAYKLEAYYGPMVERSPDIPKSAVKLAIQRATENK